MFAQVQPNRPEIAEARATHHALEVELKMGQKGFRIEEQHRQSDHSDHSVFCRRKQSTVFQFTAECGFHLLQSGRIALQI